MFGGDDVGIAGRGDEDVRPLHGLIHRHDLEAFHRRLQRADRVDFGDEHARSAIAERLRRALADVAEARSEEHTSELQSLMRISYAVFCLKKKQKLKTKH